jgi:hypothetical protein
MGEKNNRTIFSNQPGTVGGSGAAWNQLANATSNLVLNNTTFNSTFNQTTSATWTWANITPATSSVSQSSPILTLAGQYWTGSGSAPDTWTIQDVIANGTNGTSRLQFTHSGTSNADQVVAIGPNGGGTLAANAVDFGHSSSFNFNTIGYDGNSDPGLLFKGNNIYRMKLSNALQMSVSTPISWSNTTPYNAVLDVGVSRISAGILGIGNGTQGDTSGILQTAKVIGGSSMRGTVSSGSGTTVSVTFGSAYGSTPVIVVTPTSNCGTFFISAQSASGFTITYATSGAQSFNWIAIG